MAGQKPFYIVLGVVVIGGAAFVASKLRGGGPISIPANVAIVPSDTAGFRGYLVAKSDLPAGGAIGSGNEPVEITEYADFQCPACQNFAMVQWPDVQARLIQTGKVRWRFRDFPLDEVHSNPRVAAHAAACADAQGKFWEMADGIFARQMEWSPKSNPMPVFTDIAAAIGTDEAKWVDCMEAKTYAGRIEASLKEGQQLGVGSTPTFLIAGRLYESMSSDAMVKLVDSIIAARQPAGTAPKP